MGTLRFARVLGTLEIDEISGDGEVTRLNVKEMKGLYQREEVQRDTNRGKSVRMAKEKYWAQLTQNSGNKGYFYWSDGRSDGNEARH